MLSQKAMLFVAASARSIRAIGLKDTQNIPSPCMSVCQMDETTGLCGGCLRTLGEIGQWGQADAAYKRQVWHNIEARLALHQEPDA